MEECMFILTNMYQEGTTTAHKGAVISLVFLWQLGHSVSHTRSKQPVPLCKVTLMAVTEQVGVLRTVFNPVLNFSHEGLDSWCISPKLSIIQHCSIVSGWFFWARLWYDLLSCTFKGFCHVRFHHSQRPTKTVFIFSEIQWRFLECQIGVHVADALINLSQQGNEAFTGHLECWWVQFLAYFINFLEVSQLTLNGVSLIGKSCLLCQQVFTVCV